MNIEFLDELPPSKHRTGRPAEYLDFAEALRNNPGKWSKHPKQTTSISYRASMVNRINKAEAAAFRCGNFEAAQRNGVIYVRYNPTTQGA